MTRSTNWGLLLALACLTASAGPNPLADGLRDCARRTDEAQRLACFDALVSTLPKVEADQFGMTAEIARKREPVAAQRTRAEALTAKIAALGKTAGGRLIFTLDSQQVWVQSELQPAMQFEVGEPIRIEPGAMGALWLIADKHRQTRVKRVD